MTMLSEAVLRGESASFCWSPSIGGGNPHTICGPGNESID